MLVRSYGTVSRMTLGYITDSISARTENTFISAVISIYHMAILAVVVLAVIFTEAT